MQIFLKINQREHSFKVNVLLIAYLRNLSFNISLSERGCGGRAMVVVDQDIFSRPATVNKILVLDLVSEHWIYLNFPSKLTILPFLFCGGFCQMKSLKLCSRSYCQHTRRTQLLSHSLVKAPGTQSTMLVENVKSQFLQVFSLTCADSLPLNCSVSMHFKPKYPLTDSNWYLYISLQN